VLLDDLLSPRESIASAHGEIMAEQPAGLRKNKKAAFFIASGGIYEVGRAMTSFDFVEPYPRTIFGFAGVTDTSFLAGGGVAALTCQNSTWMHPHC